jgi:hypothetical protein
MISVRIKEGRYKEDKISPVWFASENEDKTYKDAESSHYREVFCTDSGKYGMD